MQQSELLLFSGVFGILELPKCSNGIFYEAPEGSPWYVAWEVGEVMGKKMCVARFSGWMKSD